MTHIVKRNGHAEEYDARKLYASIYAVALSVREPVGTAEIIANEIVGHVEKWLAQRHEVTANDIRRVAGKYLSGVNPHAGFLYLHHRTVG